jgi:hypothetical protein
MRVVTVINQFRHRDHDFGNRRFFVHAAPKYAAPFSPTWSTACCQEPLRARSASSLAKPTGKEAAASLDDPVGVSNARSAR